MDDEFDGDAIENLAMEELGKDLLARLTIGGSLIRSLVDVVSERIRSSPEGREIDGATVEEVASEWVDVGWLEEFASAFGSERIVTFGNPGGLYEHWGLQRAVVADRGLILDFGDLDSDPGIRVWGVWEPASDEEAFVEAFVAAYAAAWDTIGLPPMAGDCWDGDRLALSRALTSLLSSSDAARRYFVEWLLSGQGAQSELSAAPLTREGTEEMLRSPLGCTSLIGRFLDHTAGCP